MSAPDKPNNLYWQTRPGESYQATQAHRRANPENSYDAQEQWLRRVLAEWSAVHPRPLRLLDVGCGFGRLAHLCADVGGVDWFGFDFSSTMIQPLLDDPPAAYAADIADRVRVADSLDAAFPGETFDLVITISVMIHNDEADARALLDSMRRRRAPDGEIILIENLPVKGTGFVSDWHAGCWMHDFLAYADPGEAVTIDLDMHTQHGAYRFRQRADESVLVVISDCHSSVFTEIGAYSRPGVAPADSAENSEHALDLALRLDAQELSPEPGGLDPTPGPTVRSGVRSGPLVSAEWISNAEGRDYCLEHFSENALFLRGRSSRDLVVAFSSYQPSWEGIDGPLSFDFINNAIRGEKDVLLLRDTKNLWYQAGVSGIAGGVEDLADFVSSKARSYDRVNMVGSSMGGFAAILFGALTGAHDVIGIVPQVRAGAAAASEVGDPRWPAEFARIDALDPRSRHVRLDQMAFPTRTRFAALVGDQDLDDERHIALMRTMPIRVKQFENQDHNGAAVTVLKSRMLDLLF